MEKIRMKEEKDYTKLNEELLGILVGNYGSVSVFASQHHSSDYNITQAVAYELAKQAPEVLDSVQMPYLIVADNTNALIGKLVKHLIKTIKPEQTSDGKWKLVVPEWASRES